MRGIVASVSARRYAVLWSLLGGVLMADSPAWAQEEEETQDQPPRYLDLHQLDAYMELVADYRYHRVNRKALNRQGRDQRQTNRDRGFREQFGLKFSGTILDPGFITYSGDLSFGLTQNRYEEFDNRRSTRKDTDNGYLLAYDLRFNFFQGKKVSGTFYGLRQDDRINRRFQPTLDERRTGFGTNWTLADDMFPMELSFESVDTDRTGNRDNRDNEQYVESTLHYGASWLINDHHRFKLSFDHIETEQDFQGRNQQFETTSDLFVIEHELEFGEEQQHSLRTLVHWQEESGDFARDLFEIGPQLTLKHSDSLQTLYKYQFNRQRYDGLDVETQRGDFQIVHQLYSNLMTTVDVFALYEDVENDINTTQWGGSVDWQYNRKNPFGHFYANLALAYDTEQVDGEDGLRIVLDESHTFRDPVAIVLRNRNIVARTIVVTDLTNRRFFRPGVDYFVVRQSNVMRIVRNRSGQINDGDTVLVDYQYETPTDGQLDSVRVDFRLEQQFTNGWTPYYRLSYRNQEDDASVGFSRRADRTDHHRVGVNYKHDRFSAGTEYEVFDDTIEPYNAFHLRGLVHIMKRPEQTLDLSTNFSRFDFKGGVDDRNVTLMDVSFDHRWRVSDLLSTVERIAYRIEEDSIAGTTQGWDVAVGFEYVIGDLRAELTLEYDRLDLASTDDEDFGVYVRLRRDFTNVLGTR